MITPYKIDEILSPINLSPNDKQLVFSKDEFKFKEVYGHFPIQVFKNVLPGLNEYNRILLNIILINSIKNKSEFINSGIEDEPEYLSKSESIYRLLFSENDNYWIARKERFENLSFLSDKSDSSSLPSLEKIQAINFDYLEVFHALVEHCDANKENSQQIIISIQKLLLAKHIEKHLLPKRSCLYEKRGGKPEFNANGGGIKSRSNSRSTYLFELRKNCVEALDGFFKLNSPVYQEETLSILLRVNKDFACV